MSKETTTVLSSKPNLEKFTHEQVVDAIRLFLEFGKQTAGTAHLGYFSGQGWAARCLRSHLAALQSAAPAAQQGEVVSDSPTWSPVDEAVRWLNEIELVQGGANGPTIKLRAAIMSMGQIDIKAAALRLMGWPLPKDFSPDCGISFDGRGPDAGGYAKTWPIGTNLLTVVQAEEMLAYALGTTPPQAAQPAALPAVKMSTCRLTECRGKPMCKQCLAALPVGQGEVAQ